MLNTLPSPKTNKKAKKLGRGMSSGVGGHTVGRGMKGQTARGGHKSPTPFFEGGQNPLSRRLPKLRGAPKNHHGYTSSGYRLSMLKNSPVKLSDLVEKAKENKVTDVEIGHLVDWGLVKPKFNKDLVIKVLLDKEVKDKINLIGIPVSKSVKEAVEKNGGKVE